MGKLEKEIASRLRALVNHSESNHVTILLGNFKDVESLYGDSQWKSDMKGVTIVSTRKQFRQDLESPNAVSLFKSEAYLKKLKPIDFLKDQDAAR